MVRHTPNRSCQRQKRLACYETDTREAGARPSKPEIAVTGDSAASRPTRCTSEAGTLHARTAACPGSHSAGKSLRFAKMRPARLTGPAGRQGKTMAILYSQVERMRTARTTWSGCEAALS